jgi:hypothetical protein
LSQYDGVKGFPQQAAFAATSAAAKGSRTRQFGSGERS